VAGEAIGKIKEKIDEIKGKIKDWGSELLQNFINGIKEKIQALKDAVSSVTSTIAGKLKHTVPKEGPLSDDDKWGGHFVDNIAKGIDVNRYKVADAIDSLAGDMVFDTNSSDYGFETQNDVQQFEFTFAEGNAPLLQIARLLFPYMRVVQKEKGVS
jgi:hypothetical protein